MRRPFYDRAIAAANVARFRPPVVPGNPPALPSRVIYPIDARVLYELSGPAWVRRPLP